MKVKCINRGGKDLLGADIASGNTRSSVFHVTRDREYAIYGLAFFKTAISYLIVDDNELPSWHPASLFLVVDNRLSRHWRIYNHSSTDEYFVVIAPPDFAESLKKYEALALGESDTRANFFELRNILDLEYEDSSIVRTAEPLEGKWVLCPICAEAWEVMNLDAMVKCPKCQQVSHNPKYSSALR